MSAELIYEDNYFKILRGKDFILVRKDKPYKYHAHFKREDGAYLIIKLFNKKLIPYEEYFTEAMRRVTTPEEFEFFREQEIKPKYKNSARRFR